MKKEKKSVAVPEDEWKAIMMFLQQVIIAEDNNINNDV